MRRAAVLAIALVAASGCASTQSPYGPAYPQANLNGPGIPDDGG
ncbi:MULTISPECIES: hypothetical protein [unclassified Luteimonas]